MNRIERMRATLEGKTPDRVPVGMWYHYNTENDVKTAIEQHFDFVKEVDLDVIKIMYDNDYLLNEKIDKVSDWYKIKPLGKDSKYFKKQRDILRGLAEKGQGEYPIWMTMFGAFKLAAMATSDEMVMAHSKENPEALKSGVRAIADSICEWAEAFLDESADGIFYSAQFGEVGRFDRDLWQEIVKPFDLMVLDVAENKSDKYNVLHLCGEPDYGYKVHIDRFADYPGAMVNWAIYPNNYEIERGKDLFMRPIMGGLDNHGVMAKGTVEEIASMVHELIDRYGTKGFAIGADCSIESSECVFRIKAAVDASKSYVAHE